MEPKHSFECVAEVVASLQAGGARAAGSRAVGRFVARDRGVLAGRYNDGIPEDARATRRPQVKDRITDRGVAVARALAKLAADKGMTVTQLALLWCKDQPGITAPIIGPRTLEQLDDALGILDADLDDETRAACDELVPPGSAVADFHNTSFWMKERVDP